MYRVAPFAGAWIEMANPATHGRESAVAPFAGAWIEMAWRMPRVSSTQSLPSRERGLKSAGIPQALRDLSRSLRGSVD